MRAISRIKHLFLSLFASRTLDASLDEEMRQYVEEIAHRKVQAGFRQAEAWRQARLEFGGIAQAINCCQSAL